jgi:hypothetical protein
VLGARDLLQLLAPQYADTGLLLQQAARAHVAHTSLRRMRLGALCAFANTEGSCRLHIHDCYGAETQEWVTPRRPQLFTQVTLVA